MRSRPESPPPLHQGESNHPWFLANERCQDIAFREYVLVRPASVIGGGIVITSDLSVGVAQHLAAVGVGFDGHLIRCRRHS